MISNQSSPQCRRAKRSPPRFMKPVWNEAMVAVRRSFQALAPSPYKMGFGVVVTAKVSGCIRPLQAAGHVMAARP